MAFKLKEGIDFELDTQLSSGTLDLVYNFSNLTGIWNTLKKFCDVIRLGAYQKRLAMIAFYSFIVTEKADHVTYQKEKADNVDYRFPDTKAAFFDWKQVCCLLNS